MSNPIYELHRQDNLRLARSIVFKFGYEAKANNDLILASGKEVSEDPTTWRYYMNLNGDYHPSNIPMEVVSLDSRTTVPVTKNSLLFHPVTRREMRVGGTIYEELVRKYPTQLTLIHGIINPVPTSVSIPAKECTILSYDKSLVEEQESNLISEVQELMYSTYERWHIDTHENIGELNSTAFLIFFAKTIFDAIALVRQENVHSNRAHSYHIWRYLSSHGKLDRYRPYLTRNQMLWLYRELKVLINNAGQEWTLEELIENLLTPIGVRAYQIEIAQNSGALLDPVLEVRRRNLNFKDNTLDTLIKVNTNEVNERLNAGKNLPADTVSRISEMYANKRADMLTSDSPTKVVETLVPNDISLITDAEISFLVRQWGYLALKGLYTADITVSEKRSGVMLTIDTKTAYMLYLRMQLLVDNNSEYDLTTFGIPRALSIHLPNPEDIINANDLVNPHHVVELLNDVKFTTPFGQVKDFQEFCTKQRNAITIFDLRAQQKQNSYQEAAYYSVLHLLRRDVALPISNDIMTSEWLAAISPALPNYRAEEAKELIMEIIVQATGVYFLEGYNKSAIRDQLVKLIGELTTYHVSFIENEVDESPLNARMEVPKVADFSSVKIAKTYCIPRDEDKVAHSDSVKEKVVIPDKINDTIVTLTRDVKVDTPPQFLGRVVKTNSCTIRSYMNPTNYRLLD